MTKKPFHKAAIGFNHNVNRKGKVYHIQTEDSGVGNPLVITHLFVGGNILATKKSSYEAFLADPNLTQKVREMMEEQHKEMLRSLVAGAFEKSVADAPSYQPGEIVTSPVPIEDRTMPLPLVELAHTIPFDIPNPMPTAPHGGTAGRPDYGATPLPADEASLDEIILRYLASEGEDKS